VYFLELRLSHICETRDAMRRERNAQITPAEEAQAIADATRAGRKAMPGDVFPPRFNQLVHQGMINVCTPGHEDPPAHSPAAKIIMPFYLVVGGVLTIAGLYVAYWWNSRGGYMW